MRGMASERGCVPLLEGDERLNQVAFLAHPRYEVTEIWAVGAVAVYDEGDVFARHVIR